MLSLPLMCLLDLDQALVAVTGRRPCRVDRPARRVVDIDRVHPAVTDVGVVRDGQQLVACFALRIHPGPQVRGALGIECAERIIRNLVARSEEDVAMQVAATNPKYKTSDEIAEDAKKAAVAVFEAEVVGKPEEMKAKILEGKMASYFKDQVLLEQAYIKDESKTMRDLLNEATQKFGERVEISGFARFSARG